MNTMMPLYLPYISRAIGICLALILIIACQASMAKETDPETAIEPSYLFYPPLPNPPRIQYLATFSSSKDFEEEKESSGFLAFVLGDEMDENVRYVSKPYGVALNEGRIHLVDTRGYGYSIFDLKNNRYDVVYPTGAGSMQKPINITIDNDGTKYITDTAKAQIFVFSKDDKFLKAIGTIGQFKPIDVAIDGSRLFVSDIKNHQIQVLDKATGNLISTIAEAGSDEGKLFHPTNLAIGADNHLYVSDTGNFRVQKFTLEGEHVKTFGSIGTNPGQMARPKGIAVDHAGNIYVVDAAFSNVQIFNPAGNLLLFFGGPAKNHPSGMYGPTDITINYESVSFFQKYAAPKFQLEYVILVANQFGSSKVNVFGFGKMQGISYTED